MDYDWEYYLEDFREEKAKGRSGRQERSGINALTYRLPDNRRKQIRNLIGGMLWNYRQQGNRLHNLMIEELVKAHAEYCRQLSADEAAKRRHNALVYRYMMKTALHNKAVAARLGVALRTVHNDIAQAVGELTVLCFGIPVASDNPATYEAAVRSLLRHYQLIKCVNGADEPLEWASWQREREDCQRITGEAVSCLENLVGIYEDFVAESIWPEMQRRPLEVVKALYIDRGRTTAEIEAQLGISKRTVYADVNKITERFGMLAACIAEGEMQDVQHEQR